MEILNSTTKKSLLDPRTKLLLLTLVSVIVLGNAGGDAANEFRYVLNYLPLFLLLASRRIGKFLYGLILYTIGYALQLFLVPHVHGLAGYLVLAVAGILLRFQP